MILDALNSMSQYRCLDGNFGVALDFAGRSDLRDLPLGRHDIHGQEVYALVMKEQGRPREGARLEAHRRYADIQIVLSGTEEMGWKPGSSCKTPTGGYDADKDVQFFEDEPDTWFSVQPGQFVVFFPEDPHLPMVSKGELHKVVIKVAVT